MTTQAAWTQKMRPRYAEARDASLPRCLPHAHQNLACFCPLAAISRRATHAHDARYTTNPRPPDHPSSAYFFLSISSVFEKEMAERGLNPLGVHLHRTWRHRPSLRRPRRRRSACASLRRRKSRSSSGSASSRTPRSRGCVTPARPFAAGTIQFPSPPTKMRLPRVPSRVKASVATPPTWQAWVTSSRLDPDLVTVRGTRAAASPRAPTRA
jgi:hypothetical protein